MNAKVFVPWIIILSLVISILLLINTLRFLSDASYGTSSHINLSDWIERLDKIRLEDINASGIRESDVPITISAEQMQLIYKTRASAPDVIPLPLMPHLEDPWGGLLRFELLSISPIHWRITSRIGRTFFGNWVFGIRKIPWKNSVDYKTN